MDEPTITKTEAQLVDAFSDAIVSMLQHYQHTDEIGADDISMASFEFIETLTANAASEYDTQGFDIADDLRGDE